MLKTRASRTRLFIWSFESLTVSKDMLFTREEWLIFWQPDIVVFVPEFERS